MTYSRKRYWLAMTAMLAIAAATVILRIWLHPAHAWLSAIAMATMAVVFALGLLAYFSRDEIQRQNNLRAWYWGGTLAILLGLVPFMLISSNTMLVTMVGFLTHALHVPEAVRHAPSVYFAMGVTVTLFTQALGYYVARIVLRFRS
jgi:hypothetical protein